MGSRVATAVALLGSLLGSLLGCGGAASTQAGVAASCVGPRVSVTPTTARPGDVVRVSGEWFAADCYDTGQRGAPPPLRGLTIQVVQGGHTWTGASGVDAAGSHYTFTVPVAMPQQLRAGEAKVAVRGYGPAATLRITPSSP